MATEAPDVALRDWSITIQDDGTVRVCRTDDWRTRTFLSLMLVRLKWMSIFAGLFWLTLQFPPGLQWVTLVGCLLLAPPLAFTIVAFCAAIPKCFVKGQHWILGVDFLEVHRGSGKGWRVEAMQACTVCLVESSYVAGKSIWFLQLDGESAREHGLPKEIRDRYDPSIGYVLGLTTNPNGIGELQALGDLISRYTGWTFIVRPMAAEGSADTEQSAG